MIAAGCAQICRHDKPAGASDMPRNIVLCCDGTANEFASDRTNVVKLFYGLVQDADRQIVSYHPGLGTMEAPGALTGLTKAITLWAPNV
jgi:uncharacterized protein (DUF2235 family)